MRTITIGIDLAKSVFAACELDGGGRVSQRRELRREPFAQWLAQLPAGTVVAMEACSGSRIGANAKADERSRRLQQIIGVGALTADALVATIGDGRDFKNGRQFAAWLGLTPAQHSSGGKARLGGITRRGDGYLRTLLIQGARSSLQRAQAVSRERATPEQIWIRELAARMPFGKVIVAIANKHARQAWAMLARGEDYDAQAWLKHPMTQRPARKRRVAQP